MDLIISDNNKLKFPHRSYDEIANPIEIDYKSLIIPFSKFKSRLEKNQPIENKQKQKILQKNLLVAELNTF